MSKNKSLRMNVEIKVRVNPDLQLKIEEELSRLGATYLGVEKQIDTYFVTEGRKRLKLRVKTKDGKNLICHLVAYSRENVKKPRECLYFTQPITQDFAVILKDTLKKFVTVEKVRKTYRVNEVTFTLDEVRDLGYFVEIKARAEKGSEKAASGQVKSYAMYFGLREENFEALSYSDLLCVKKGP